MSRRLILCLRVTNNWYFGWLVGHIRFILPEVNFLFPFVGEIRQFNALLVGGRVMQFTEGILMILCNFEHDMVTLIYPLKLEIMPALKLIGSPVCLQNYIAG
jgi:hypothetical protein